VPVLYRRDPTGVVYIPTHGSDEVAGLQREKQASNPILRSFHERKVMAALFFETNHLTNIL
jgi:hypothetical protein